MQSCRAIWNDVKYFPIPQSLDDTEDKISYVDSWMFERNYGGKRGHEGTDIMAEKNTPGYYPVVSMTDGVVTGKRLAGKGRLEDWDHGTDGSVFLLCTSGFLCGA